jgi:transcriptional regulator with XRE-family HTH domain
MDVKINLAAVRVNTGMTQKEWADALTVDLSTVTNWEKGKSEPTWSKLRRMSELSGIPIDFIFVPNRS